MQGHVLQRLPQGARIQASLGTIGLDEQVSLGLRDQEGKALSEAVISTSYEKSTGLLCIELAGLPPGGPFTFQAICRQGDRIRELSCTFLVGDLWLMGGQSNMEGLGLLEDAAIPHPLIQNFTMARVWEQAREPLHFLAESLDPVHHQGFFQTSEMARDAKKKAIKGSGVGLHFARLMLERTGVPQGLLACAHGGTSMEQWSPELEGEHPGDSLFGSMMLSVQAVGQPLAGVLWYQGESDARDDLVPLYRDRMVKLVKAVRERTGQGELPWLMVQIGKEIGRSWQPGSWHRIQEEQRKLPDVIPFSDIVSSADLEHDDWIHISGRAFPQLAHRLATLAERLALGKEGELPAPQPLRAVWDPDSISPRIRLDYKAVDGSLVSPGRPLGFCLADANLKEFPLVYQVRHQGPSTYLRLTNDDVLGLGVFHGLDCNPACNSLDGRGMPLPVFGPLAIENMPARSPWFRHWRISPALETAPRDPALLDHQAWQERYIEGWNVVNLHDEWSRTEELRVFRTWIQVPAPMPCKLEVVADGPVQAWLDRDPVLDDPRPLRDFGESRMSSVLDLGATSYCLTVMMSNRGGQAYGFAARLLRTDIAFLGEGDRVPLECTCPC